MFQRNLKNQISQLTEKNDYQQKVLQALYKVMAVIEFSADGIILEANDNFLQTVGYQKTEIIGQHHKLFMFEMDAASSHYQQFWLQLAQGKFFSDRYKRKNKNGDTIWLEASYNPIFDAQGRVQKIIKFATDITRQVQEELDARAQLTAINKVMAVIEFDTQGNILSANKNFLDTMGYSLNELKGKHHRIFAPEKLANSTEYRQFWEKLSHGMPVSGTFQRINKQGKEIWLEASYNPIFDIDGNVIKVIKYASDIGANPNTKMLDEVIHDVTAVIDQIAHGNLNAKMQSHKPKQATMYDKNIVKLENSLMDMSDKLSSIIDTVSISSNEFKHQSNAIVSGSQTLNSHVKHSSEQLGQTFTTMKNSTAMIRESSEEARKTASITQEVQNKTSDGVKVMNQTVSAMDEIQESSEKISEIVSLIDGIAFQTNLLALNAAVEAARAGDHGRGFAVVAGEVRALAQKSAAAAKDIRNLIQETVERVSLGSKLANQSGKMLDEINQSILIVGEQIQTIANSAAEQATETEKAYQGIMSVQEIMSKNLSLVEENTLSAESISSKATELAEDMTYFSLDHNSLIHR